MVSLKKGVALETKMSRQTNDQSLIYYETGVIIFNCRLCHLDFRPEPLTMYPIMTGKDKNLLFYAFLFKSTEPGLHGVIQECK